jgi:hypothetical protein
MHPAAAVFAPAVDATPMCLAGRRRKTGHARDRCAVNGRSKHGRSAHAERNRSKRCQHFDFHESPQIWSVKGIEPSYSAWKGVNRPSKIKGFVNFVSAVTRPKPRLFPIAFVPNLGKGVLRPLRGHGVLILLNGMLGCRIARVVQRCDVHFSSLRNGCST